MLRENSVIKFSKWIINSVFYPDYLCILEILLSFNYVVAFHSQGNRHQICGIIACQVMNAVQTALCGDMVHALEMVAWDMFNQFGWHTSMLLFHISVSYLLEFIVNCNNLICFVSNGGLCTMIEARGFDLLFGENLPGACLVELLQDKSVQRAGSDQIPRLVEDTTGLQ